MRLWESIIDLVHNIRVKPENECGVWKRPSQSIGPRLEDFVDGHKALKCWFAVGDAAKAWETLQPDLMSRINDCIGKYNHCMAMEIYMIGESEESAAPNIFISCPDQKLHKDIRRVIKESAILTKYPGIILRLDIKLPNLLAGNETGQLFVPTQTEDTSRLDGTPVYTDPSDPAFGRTLVIYSHSRTLPRLATGGPIIHINGHVFQITAGHAFRANEEESSPSMVLTADLGFYQNQIETAVRSTSSTDSIQKSPSDPEVRNVRQRLEPALNTLYKQEYLGMCTMLSDTGNRPDLDYALIELEGKYRRGKNQIEIGEDLLSVTGVWEFGPVYQEDNALERLTSRSTDQKCLHVVTYTPSSGLLEGIISPNSSYMRLPGYSAFQELYPVHFKGKLHKGDCGAGVIVRFNGMLYGHIVAGRQGTGIAYLMPAKKVIQDISERLAAGVAFTKLAPITHYQSKERKLSRLDPLLNQATRFANALPDFIPRVTEQAIEKRKDRMEKTKRPQAPRRIDVGSKEFFDKIARPLPQMSTHEPEREQTLLQDPERDTSTTALSLIHGSSDNMRNSRPMHQHCLAFRDRQTIPGGPNSKTKANMFDKPKIPSDLALTRHKESHKYQRYTDSVIPGFSDAKQTVSETLQQRIFSLPNDLPLQIIASLPVPDILNLRLVSKAWNDFVSQNEGHISREYLERNMPPHFAVQLYPEPQPPDLNLNYLAGLRFRLKVSSELSEVISQWLTKEVFLRKTDEEINEFVPVRHRICHRLSVTLFTVFHFFEEYRRLLLEYLTEPNQDTMDTHETGSGIESQIMRRYNDVMLLQTHQIFPILMMFVDRLLRPPSYLGHLERSIMSYNSNPISKDAQSVILCIGGLEQLLKFAKIRLYEDRIKAVNDWFGFASDDTPRSDSHTSESPLESGQYGRFRAFKGKKKLSRLRYTLTGHQETSKNSINLSTSNQMIKACSISLTREPPIRPFVKENCPLLLSVLPRMGKLWISTGESQLLERQVIRRTQEIKQNTLMLLELISPNITDADLLYYGQAVTVPEYEILDTTESTDDRVGQPGPSCR
jgi:hypothetical protein